MAQQPQEPAPDLEVSAVEAQPPQEPNVHFPRRRRLALILSALAIVLVVGVSLGSYLVITRAQHSHAPTIGARLTPTPTIPLAQRWRLVDSPTIGKDSTLLSGVAASSPTAAWAWGADTITSTSNGGPGYVSEAPLLLHWDGQGWKTMTIPPDPHLVNIIIGGIAALSPDNAWLVGSAETVEGGFGDVFPSCVLMHWDGHQWSQTSPPASLLQHSSCELEGITALSATDIWAVGYTGDLAPAGSTFLINVRQTLIVHWDGQQWSVVAVQAPGLGSILSGLAQVPNTGQMWAVGGWGQSTDPTTPTTTLTLLMH